MGDLFPGCSRWNCWLWTSLEEIIIYWELSGHPRIPFTTKMGADAARAKEAGPEGGSRPQPQRTPGMCIARSSEKTWTKQTIMNKELHALNTKTSVEMWQLHLFCSFYTCSSATLMLHPASASLIPVLRRASSQMHLKERKSDWGEPGLSLSSHSSWSGYILILTKWLLWVLSPRLLMFKCAYSSRSKILLSLSPRPVLGAPQEASKVGLAWPVLGRFRGWFGWGGTWDPAQPGVDGFCFQFLSWLGFPGPCQQFRDFLGEWRPTRKGQAAGGGVRVGLRAKNQDLLSSPGS